MCGPVIESLSQPMYNPAHPGEIIQEYMEGLDLTVSALAAHLKITRANLSRIIDGKTGVSAEMVLRLSDAFRTCPQVWIRSRCKAKPLLLGE